jgi:hypothetical protein
MVGNSWPEPVRNGTADNSGPAAAQDADMQAYFAARDNIISTMRAWIAWWGPIRKKALAAYRDMDEENRTLIDALESLWRAGPAGPDETQP